MPAIDNQKRCFVVMGFGVKTDFSTGRKLDLDRSYRLLIKPVVEAKGLVCVRADEIVHSGAIDERMYQELLKADVVIADLSTANLNAFYELGIRHALRPHTTIVISEDKLPYPFDLNHINITSYTHLGDAIDYEEVERFRKVLGNTLETVLKEVHVDSPVYTYLKQLVPPALQEQTAKAVEDVKDAMTEVAENISTGGDAEENVKHNATLAMLIEQGEKAIHNKEYITAKALFTSALQIGKYNSNNKTVTNDPYLIHRLVLATYKAKQPDEISALHEAIKVLSQLDLKSSNDPETVTVAGAIEKRLYEKGEGDCHLERSILYFRRGYYLRNDTYNGINLAFLLNCRVDSSLDATKEEQIADMVWANRIRSEVLHICEKELKYIKKREGRIAARTVFLDNDDLIQDQKVHENEFKFWTLVNKAEALFGLGEQAAYKEAVAAAQAVEHTPEMMESLEKQVQKLNSLLEKYGHLLGSSIIKPTKN